MSDVYEEGYEAFGKGLTQGDNPHGGNSDRESRWNEGWEDAKIDLELKRSATCHEDRTDRL